MALSEIEKLERRYAENPQGLTFAPLAEVHRKNGDVTRALELLRPGLELHPNYIPASIVLGRCHLDLGDLPAAEAAFAHVLELDGENVIALKALADINERLHHFDKAEQWLQTLLSVDRSNDDARAQLQRIEAARQQSGLAAVVPDEPPPAVVAEAESETASAEPVEVEAMEPEPAEAEPTEPEPLILADLEPAEVAAGEPEPPPPGLQVEETVPIEEPVEPIAGLVGRELDQPEERGSEFRVELNEEIVLSSSGGHEFQTPDASQELAASVPVEPSPFGEEPLQELTSADEPPASAEPAAPTMVMEPPPPPEPEPEPQTASEPEPEPHAEPVAQAESAPEPEREPEPPAAPEPAIPEIVAVPEPEPVVTETMAEVLLQQGHAAEALEVYRELEGRGTGDPRLRQKIAELEEETRPEPAPPARRYAAAETGGRSVGDFLREVLSARPPAGSPAPAARSAAAAPAAPADSGAPTRPAADALSLSSVFGEETSPLPPAMPAAGATPAGGVSFDEFYSAPGPAGAPRQSRGPDPKNDDLDQFHAWLQNLKR